MRDRRPRGEQKWLPDTGSSFSAGFSAVLWAMWARVCGPEMGHQVFYRPRSCTTLPRGSHQLWSHGDSSTSRELASSGKFPPERLAPQPRAPDDFLVLGKDTRADAQLNRAVDGHQQHLSGRSSWL